MFEDAPHNQCFETCAKFRHADAAQCFLDIVASRPHGGARLLVTNKKKPQHIKHAKEEWWVVDYATPVGQAEFWRGYASGIEYWSFFSRRA